MICIEIPQEWGVGGRDKKKIYMTSHSDHEGEASFPIKYGALDNKCKQQNCGPIENEQQLCAPLL